MKIDKYYFWSAILCALTPFIVYGVLVACSGCHGVRAPSITAPAGSTPASVAAALISITSIPYLGVLAMSGAVFIAFMGNPKLGMAVGAAGGAALALSLAVIKYAWILGLLSVVAMIACGAFAILGNRKFKKQMVLGVQNIKEMKSRFERDKVNEAMIKALDPDCMDQVLKIKGAYLRQMTIKERELCTHE